MRCAREDEDDGGGGGDEEGLRVAGRGRQQRQRGMRGEKRRGEDEVEKEDQESGRAQAPVRSMPVSRV